MSADTLPLMGRRQINHQKMLLGLAEGTLQRVDAALAPGEKRAEFIRAAIEAELVRRARRPRRKPAKAAGDDDDQAG